MATRVGARAKLRNYLTSHAGQVLDSNTLREVAGTSEWARRLRELRDEEGLDIASHNDDSSLRPGQYILKTLHPRPHFERAISKETRSFVLDRNGFTCQQCGAGAGEPHPHDPSRKTRLHIGHIIDKSMGGADDPANLRAICSICNEGLANIALERPSSAKVLAQLRRATGQDQLEVLRWLIRKFPQQARSYVEEP